MGFQLEPNSYEKTILSDLQGAWVHLRSKVAEAFDFPDSARMLFHIDEAMSWESVRNLKQMKFALLLVENICAQSEAPVGIKEALQAVRECFDQTLVAEKEGKLL